MTVRANMGEDSVEEQVVVNVLDVNDEAPVFVGEPYSASVVEVGKSLIEWLNFSILVFVAEA